MKIIVLDSTAKSIKAVLASSVATSNPDFVVAYADTSDNTFSELSSDGQLNGTTDVTLVSAPASGVKRAIKSITIYNRDTAAVTVSIKFDNGGTQRILQRVQLVSGETWHSDELTKLSPGGSDTQVQFNDLGTLAGNSNFTYNKTTSVLTLGANPVLSGGTANGILYLNGSKVATSGSALTFDGTTFTVNSAASIGSNTAKTKFYSDSTYNGIFNGASLGSNECIYMGAGIQFFYASGSEQMRLTSTGLGIGTSSPGAKLQVNDGLSFGLQVGKNTSNNGMRVFDLNNNLTLASNLNVTVVLDANNDDVTGTFKVVTNGESGTELLTLNESGNLGLGVTPSAWSVAKGFEIASPAGITSAGTGLNVGTNTYFNGSNWIYKTSAAATLAVQTSGTHYWSIAPSGTAGNAITWTQAMTLDASGRLGIGLTSPHYMLHINGGSGSRCDVQVTYNALGTSGSNGAQFGIQSGGAYIWNFENSPVYFATNNTERARITSAGNLLVGTTSTPSSSVAGTLIGNSGPGGRIVLANTITTTYQGVISFINGNGTVGTIDTSGSSTSYVTSSDYRLKNTITPMTGALAKVALLKPCTYKWNVDGSDGEGFIAHELAEVCPQAVSGEKDAVDAEGNPQYQGIDTSFLVATLTAAIQEQQALITALTARVAALEGTQP